MNSPDVKGKLGDCDCGGAIMKQLGNEAKCDKCGTTYDVVITEEAPTPPPPPPPPAKLQIGKLNPPKALSLPQAESIKLDEKSDEIPSYIKNSRPWRWAHELLKTGNPYREDSKNWKIFQQVVTNDQITVPQLVQNCSTLIGEKLSYLLLVHEVLSQCIAAGLLLIDSEGRLTVCKEQPKPQSL